MSLRTNANRTEGTSRAEPEPRAPRRTSPLSLFAAGLVAAGAIAACAAEDSGSLTGRRAGEPGDGAGNETTTPDDQRTAGQLRRLTHGEYDNTVRDLLGVTADRSRLFPEDQQIGIFENNVQAGTVSRELGEQYLDAADGIAKAALEKFEAVVGCPEDAPADRQDGCAKDFVARLGRRAYRRPLTTNEAAGLVGLFERARGASDFPTAVHGVLTAMLVSPNFLYRIEFGRHDATTGAAAPLTSYEVASRLSYALWSSMPDDALFDAAAKDELATPEQLAAQARRLLADSRAKTAVGTFYDQWLRLKMLDDLTKDASQGRFDGAVKQALAGETHRFIESIVWEGDAKLTTLLSAPWSYVNATTAPFYGVQVAGDALVKTQLDPAQRAGILTHASILSHLAKGDESSPIKRGAFVRNRLLCQKLVEPNEAIPPLPPIAEGLTTRQRIAAHTSNPACAGCHTLIDGVGFGLENYDAVGRWRTTDEGKPVDAVGEITSTSDANGSYTGGVELAKKLAASTQVRDCMATLWFRWVSGHEEGSADDADVVALRSAFASTGGDLKELLVQTTQMPSFTTHRRLGN